MKDVFFFVRFTFAAAVILVAALVPVSASAAGADAIPGSRVLVMPFSAKVDAGAPGGAGAALWLGEAASVLVTEGLTNVGVGALGREQRVAAFDRLDLPMSGALSRATIIRVAELVGATDVIFGDVELGDRLQVHARLVRLDTGSEIPVVSDSANLSDIFALFGRVAGRFSAAIGRASVASTVATPMPLEAFESYMKGLVAPTPAGEQKFLEAAEQQAPADARVLMALWRVYNAQGQPDKALAAANAVPATSRLGRDARFAVAISLVQLKRFDGAYQALTALYAGGQSAAISNALGVVQLRRGAPAGTRPATEFFHRAIEEDPDNTDYLFNAGYAYALGGDAANALTSLREAVRLDATNGDAHLVMSAVLASSGRVPEGQREFELAAQLGPTSPTPPSLSTKVPPDLERLGTALDMNVLSELNAAIANPAEHDQQETALFHLSRAKTFLTAGRDRDAANELRRAIYLQPYGDEPHLLLGQVYLRTGRTGDAIDEFKVALWCRETTAGHVALGGALLTSGEREAAKKEVDRALAMSPDSADARSLLKRIGG